MQVQQKYMPVEDPEFAFRQQLAVIRAQHTRTYATVTIDLTVARTNAVYDIPGDHLSPTQLDGLVQIRFNELDNPQLTLNDYPEGIDGPFHRFYITNAAQASGTQAKLTIGRAGNFRVTAKNSQQVPINLGGKHGYAATLNTDIFSADLAPVNTPTLFRAMVMLETSGVFSAQLKNGGATKVLKLNAGVALVASAVYGFDILVHAGDTVNYQTTVSGNVTLRVQEIDAATQ